MAKRLSLHQEDETRGAVEGYYRRMGYAVWGVPRTASFRAAKDVFGCFDFLAAKDHLVIYGQVTTAPNHAAHRTKIITFFSETGVELPAAVLWSWHAKRQGFRVEEWLYAKREREYWIHRTEMEQAPSLNVSHAGTHQAKPEESSLEWYGASF